MANSAWTTLKGCDGGGEGGGGYHAQEQRLPVLIGEGQDLMVKVKVLPLAAQGEMVEN